MKATKELVNRAYTWAERYPVTLALVGLGIGMVAAVIAVRATVVTEQQGNRITKVERSVCTKAPASKACARIREKIARAEPIRNPCISHQRVEGTRGRNCPRFYVRTPSELQVAPDLGDGTGNSSSEGGEAPASGGSHPASQPGTGGDSSDQPAPANPTGPRQEPPSEPGQGGSGGSQPPTSTSPAASPT